MKTVWKLAAAAASFAAIAVVGCNATTGRDTPVTVSGASDAGIECVSALGCPEGLICVQGFCDTANACDPTTGVACPQGEICDQNVCKSSTAVAPPSCRVSTDCPAGMDCNQSQCQPRTASSLALNPSKPCTSDGDCPPLLLLACIDGACRPVPSCETDANCPHDRQCEEGLCLRKAPDHCAVDEDCSGGERCVNRHCVAQ